MRDATDGRGAGATGPPRRLRWELPVAPDASPGPAVTLTPNPRAARAHGVEPRSFERLARDLLRPLGLQPAPELARWRTLRDAVREVLTPQDVDGTTRAVGATVREVLRAGVHRAPSEGSERLLRITALAHRYRDALLARGLVDPAETLWQVAREGPYGDRPPPRLRLRVVGYPRFGAAELAFLTAVAGPGSAVELPDGDDALYEDVRALGRALEQHGWTRRARDASEGAPAPAAPVVRGWRLPSREAEVRAVLGEVRRLLIEGTPADAIALAARDDVGYAPLVRAVAWEYGLPVVAAFAAPLRDTAVGAWTATLLEVVREGLPFEATARLLAHPLGEGLAPAAWDGARATHPHGAAAWGALDPRAEELAWPARDRRDALTARLRRAWQRFGVAGGVADAAASRPTEVVALQRLAGAVADLARPADEVVTLGAFLREVDALLRLLAVPADAGRRGVELHTPLALYGARVRHLFVLGAAEGVLPQRIADDAVLDFAERAAAARAGLPLEGAAEAARREALSLKALLWTVGSDPEGSLTLSFAEDEGIASPIFAELGVRPGPPPGRPPASAEEARRRRLLDAPDAADDAVLDAARRAWRIERGREDGSPPDAYDGIVGEPFPVERHLFSATQLLDLGQCAFRWLCRIPLGLAEAVEADDDVSPLLRGRLYHRTLELALERARAAIGAAGSGAELRQAALDALAPSFEQAEAEEGAFAVPAWELRRGPHLEQLARVLRAPSFLPDDATVAALERWFPPRDGREARWRGFPVHGKVDRIDRRPDGAVLIDYKTRSTRPSGAQDEHGKARLDLQLPLYLEAAAPALLPGERVAGAQYYSLTKAEVLREVRLDPALERDLDAFADRTRGRLAAGAYPVAPDIDLAACATCDFDLVCRKGPRTERMRTAGAFELDAASEGAPSGPSASSERRP